MDSQIHPPFRSVSTTSNISLNTSTSSITRVASAPISHSFNKQSSAQDHLFWQCLNLKMKLAAIEGMNPFLNLAFNSAEQCAEQQALALSQQMQESSKINEFRSSISGFSIHSDSSNSSTINHNGSTNNSGSNNGRGLINNNIFTFTAGVLPANISVDPATQLWKLFQQGAPLCLLFNDVTNLDFKISIVGSDDLRICKKSVYDFLIAVQTYLNFDDDIMFTISNVFSDSTHDLLKIIKIVNKLLELKDPNIHVNNNINITTDNNTNSSSSSSFDLLTNDDRSKVFKEIIETERKYVQDVELLCQYKDELIQQELISNEQIHILFPNLNEIIDFQRRFLNGLECNINVPTKYQRIGSIFIHAASGPFKAYEPWTVGQLAAIDLINKESSNLRKSSSLLDPGFELQSFILKPIQRLCKYPLLLKELIKTSTDNTDQVNSASYNELLIANNAMKELANQVNEAQRRAENVEYLHKLNNRVSNWRGFNLKDQGELLYHGNVGVKDGDNEKEYVSYLFERIIFFFIEPDSAKEPKEKEKKNRRDLLSSRKKSSSMASSTTSLLETLNSDKSSPLDLKGRVYISEVYNVSSSNNGGYLLIIAWSGKKESGTFILRYRTEEIRNQWENCLRNLKTNEMNVQIHKRLRDSHDSQNTNESYDVAAAYTNFSPTATTNPPNDSISLRSNGSNHRHNSSTSTFSMMQQSRQRTRSSSGPGRTTSNGQDFNHQSVIKIKLIYNKIEIPDLLIVSTDIQFNELYSKISGKIVNSDEITDDILVNKLKYYDEDGDFVVMDSNDDWTLAIDMLNEMEENNNNNNNINTDANNNNNNNNSNNNNNESNDSSFDLTIWVS